MLYLEYNVFNILFNKYVNVIFSWYILWFQLVLQNSPDSTGGQQCSLWKPLSYPSGASGVTWYWWWPWLVRSLKPVVAKRNSAQISVILTGVLLMPLGRRVRCCRPREAPQLVLLQHCVNAHWWVRGGDGWEGREDALSEWTEKDGHCSRWILSLIGNTPEEPFPPLLITCVQTFTRSWSDELLDFLPSSPKGKDRAHQTFHLSAAILCGSVTHVSSCGLFGCWFPHPSAAGKCRVAHLCSVGQGDLGVTARHCGVTSDHQTWISCVNTQSKFIDAFAAVKCIICCDLRLRFVTGVGVFLFFCIKYIILQTGILLRGCHICPNVLARSTCSWTTSGLFKGQPALAFLLSVWACVWMCATYWWERWNCFLFTTLRSTSYS